jgi:hypothetical protein
MELPDESAFAFFVALLSRMRTEGDVHESRDYLADITGRFHGRPEAAAILRAIRPAGENTHAIRALLEKVTDPPQIAAVVPIRGRNACRVSILCGGRRAIV